MRIDNTEDILERFSEETGCPRPIPGNSVRILEDAAAFYDAMLEDIRKAEKYILMEYFVFREDTISTTVLEALAEKAEAGVRVCLVLDHFGCLQHCDQGRLFQRMKPRYINKYRSRGVDIVFFHRFRILPRNHRKLTLIDGKVTYTGGMNISDAYKNGIPGMGKFWDMHLRIEGPAVADFHAGFVRIWDECGDRPLGVSFAEAPAPCGETRLILLETPLPGKAPNPEKLYCRLFDTAKESIRLISPYFWPTRSILRSIKETARRGIKIEMLMGDNSDVPVSLVAYALLRKVRRMAKKGYFTLHIQPGGFHHEKALSIDGTLLVVGSYNLDYLSFLVNHEQAVLIDDPAVVRAYDRYFDAHARNEE